MKRVKRAGGLLLAVVMLVSLTGCNVRKHHAGAKSAEELCTKILMYLNEDEEYSEIEDWMDWSGIVAFEMIEQIKLDCDFSEICYAVGDFNNGAGYVKKHHKDFAEAWEDATGKELNQKGISIYADLKKSVDEEIADDPEAYLEDFMEFAPYDTDFDEGKLTERDDPELGWYRVRTGDDYYFYIEISYYVDGTSYVCYNIDWVYWEPGETKTF